MSFFSWAYWKDFGPLNQPEIKQKIKYYFIETWNVLIVWISQYVII